MNTHNTNAPLRQALQTDAKRMAMQFSPQLHERVVRALSENRAANAPFPIISGWPWRIYLWSASLVAAGLLIAVIWLAGRPAAMPPPPRIAATISTTDANAQTEMFYIPSISSIHSPREIVTQTLFLAQKAIAAQYQNAYTETLRSAQGNFLRMTRLEAATPASGKP